MRPPPIHNFCGFLSLTTGVIFTGLWSLLHCGTLLCFTSAAESLHVLGLVVSPETQVTLATVTLLGVPIAMLGCFGAMFRIEKDVWMLMYYMAFNTAMDTYWAARLMTAGGICESFVPGVIYRRGPLFVCIFVDMGVLFWLMVYCLFNVYLCYVVYSAAVVIARHEEAELIAFEKRKSLSYNPDDFDDELSKGGGAGNYFGGQMPMSAQPGMGPYPGQPMMGGSFPGQPMPGSFAGQPMAGPYPGQPMGGSGWQTMPPYGAPR